MVTDQNINTMTTEIKVENHSVLSNKWTLWAHLPHNTDWSIKSYIKISTLSTVEESIAIIETLPNILIENCMLFLMKDGIKPIWEDPNNRNGGCFSYKIISKNVCKTWKELSYVTIGETISKLIPFVNKVNGITISPKKNFSIIKIWMSDCTNQNPSAVLELKGLSSQGCLFKKHTPEF